MAVHIEEYIKKYLNYASLDFSQRFKNPMQLTDLIRKISENRVIRPLTRAHTAPNEASIDTV